MNTDSKSSPKKGSKSNVTAGSKSGSTSNASKKRVALNERVAFIYGGTLMKSSNVFVFAIDNKDVVAYTRKHLSPYYGDKVNGRYVNCENAEEALERVLELADEKGYRAEAGCNVLKLAVNNASALLKEATGATAAHSFKLDEDEAAPKKSANKGGKLDASKKDDSDVKDDEASDASEDEKDDVEDEKDVSEDENEDAPNADKADEAESDEEDEEVKPSRKRIQKKSNSKAAKGTSKGKKGGKTQNVKKRK